MTIFIWTHKQTIEICSHLVKHLKNIIMVDRLPQQIWMRGAGTHWDGSRAFLWWRGISGAAPSLSLVMETSCHVGLSADPQHAEVKKKQKNKKIPTPKRTCRLEEALFPSVERFPNLKWWKWVGSQEITKPPQDGCPQQGLTAGLFHLECFSMLWLNTVNWVWGKQETYLSKFILHPSSFQSRQHQLCLSLSDSLGSKKGRTLLADLTPKWCKQFRNLS